jgi:hypothetical protein
MTNLSPDAQAVLDAAINVAESPDAEAIAAAVLRAAVTQVTPVSTNARQMKIRNELLNIAEELEGVTYGTYRSDLTDRPQ